MKHPMIAILLSVFFIVSCGTSKETEKSNQFPDAKEMTENGFIKGKIVYSEVEGDCEYTIQTINEPIELLDPVNLSEEFQSDGLSIWFKYIGLREANRCEKARPIQLVEISKRSE